MDKLSSEVSYEDDRIENITERKKLETAVWIALDNLSKSKDEF